MTHTCADFFFSKVTHISTVILDACSCSSAISYLPKFSLYFYLCVDVSSSSASASPALWSSSKSEFGSCKLSASAILVLEVQHWEHNVIAISCFEVKRTIDNFYIFIKNLLNIEKHSRNCSFCWKVDSNFSVSSVQNCCACALHLATTKSNSTKFLF